MSQRNIITIVGGTGFIGRYVTKHLAKAGYRLRIISRNPNATPGLKTAGDVGQISLESGDVTRPETLVGKFEHSLAVINLVGILFESGRQKFDRIHTQSAGELAQMASAAGVERFIHISALGADEESRSRYAKTKAEGEAAVRAAFPAATILRPSVIFGPEDNFFNQFARMTSISPALPLIGGGHTLFQPVYVGDIARAIHSALIREDAKGKIYELGGPDIMNLRQIMELVLQATERERALLSIPSSVASAMGSIIQLFPKPPLTADQVRLLKTDSVVSEHALTFAALSITPTPASIIVPDYLAYFTKKAAA